MTFPSPYRIAASSPWIAQILGVPPALPVPNARMLVSRNKREGRWLRDRFPYRPGFIATLAHKPGTLTDCCSPLCAGGPRGDRTVRAQLWDYSNPDAPVLVDTVHAHVEPIAGGKVVLTAGFRFGSDLSFYPFPKAKNE